MSGTKENAGSTQALEWVLEGPGVIASCGAPDASKVQAGVRLMLEGFGLDPTHPELLETPARVAQAWLDEFLSGYTQHPADSLRERFPDAGGGPVIVTQLHFVSVCPHHLLPYAGVAHLAYLPTSGVVGLSRLSKLVDSLARRLVLQETLTTQLAQALERHADSAGSACVLHARQGCVSLRGARQLHANATTACWTGAFAQDEALRLLFLRALPAEDASVI